MNKNVPNLRQPSTGPTIYAPMVLPAMKVLPTPPARDPQLPARATQFIPANGPSRPLTPAPGLTNRPGYPVK